MIDLMPKKLISINNINDWNKYLDNFKNLNYLKKYLKDSFRVWVENCKNPLSIPWISYLLEDNLEKQENNFKKLENFLGKNNFDNLISELVNDKTKNPHAISKKIESLFGEIFAFSEIIKKYKNIKKINENGDWLCDGNVILSVKTKFSLDYNYQLIENTIKSLFFIKENNILRKYNDINLEQFKNIDDKFRNKVVWFLESHLASLLEFFDFQLNHWSSLNLSEIKYFFENNKLQSSLELDSDIYQENSKNYIDIFLKEYRSGEPELNHQIKISLSELDNQDIVDISFDTNSFWNGSEIDWESLKIKNLLEEFDSKYIKVKEQKKDFIGWINITIHPKHENYILYEEILKKNLKTIISKRKYKIFIAFKFLWTSEAQKNLIVEI